MYDLAVIGGGPGGYVAAIRAAQLGMKAVLIEKERVFGGTCLRVGCIPSKALLQSSELYALIVQKAQEHGILVNDVDLQLTTMMERKSQIVEGLAKGVAGLLKRHGIDTHCGAAAFISPYAVQVGEQKIEAKHWILATGSEPMSLPFLPIDESRVLSSTGALSLSAIPKKMLVIGAGVIGVELASVYSRLGSEVTVIEMLDHICPGMDRTIGKSLLHVLRKQGIAFHLGARVTEAKINQDAIALSVDIPEGELQEWSADAVLVAIGRRPYSKGLELEAAGISATAQGFVPVDQNFRTVQPHIFAIGDLIEGPMLAHRASDEGAAVAAFIAGIHCKVNYMAIPNVIYTYPEAAAVGLTEEEANNLGLPIQIGICSLKGNPRAHCSGDTDGMVKIIGEESTGTLLGMHILGSHASEMIGEGVMAIEKRATLQELGNAPHAHPTLCEAIKEAALQAQGRAIH
ncbi:MAG: dihydrolipoyl dehydrogenase [Waddliaceae bacterium]